MICTEQRTLLYVANHVHVHAVRFSMFLFSNGRRDGIIGCGVKQYGAHPLVAAAVSNELFDEMVLYMPPTVWIGGMTRDEYLAAAAVGIYPRRGTELINIQAGVLRALLTKMGISR